MLWKAITAILLACSFVSCSTQALWERTNPGERIWIPAAEITQAQLDQRHVKYEKYDGSFGHGYLVEKSALQKFRDYAFRALGTPAAVAIDTVTTVTVVGVLILAADVKTNPEYWNRQLNK